MKYLAMLFAPALISTQLFAASDDEAKTLCESKLNLVNHYATEKEQMTGSHAQLFRDYKGEAEKAQESGDMAKCAQAADQALRVYQKAHHK